MRVHANEPTFMLLTNRRATMRTMNVRRLLLLLFLAIPGIAEAQTSDLLISEYVEGSSNNKAIELYNGTGADIDLGADNYVLQMYFNGSTSAGLTISLTGTIANGDVFVVANSNANSGILALADQTNGSGWFNGDDAVVLRKGGTTGDVVDAIGQIGNDPGSEWGSGSASTQDNTLRRKADACTGDTDPTDAFDPSTDYDGFAQDNIDDLGSHTADCGSVSGGEVAPTVASTSPAENAQGVATDANVVITFSEDVDVAGSWFTFETSGGSSVAVNVSGGPRGFTLDPVSDLAEGETYSVTVHAANVTDQDSNDPPDAMAADYSFSFTTQQLVLISAIQGQGNTSPMEGQIVTIEGIVVGDFQPNDGDYTDLGGFYVQEEASDYDNKNKTSEGIFVYAPGAINVNPGDIVRVTGRVDEFGSPRPLTELTNVTDVTIVGSTTLPDPVEIELPCSSEDYYERYEGMRVKLVQDLVIAEFFNFDRYNEIVLAYPLNSPDRPFQGTSYRNPGNPANNATEKNLERRITLDDGRTEQNPDPAIHPNGSEFDLNNRFRGGDIVRNATGVMDDRFGLYRIQPTQGAEYTAVNPRTNSHNDVGGCLKVASFNVLNYFLTIDDGSDDCGPDADAECRGADTQQEFDRQRAKILSALSAIRADIFGLIEMENTTGVEPLADIVDGLNDIFGDGEYDYIATGTIGTDAIKVGIIYRPDAVTPVGDYETLDSDDDPRFVDTKNRPSLAQTFSENGSDEVFTVVVNHFKSKGSDCNDLGDPDEGDGQGNCNDTRTLAAEALVDWLATDPTGSGDDDFLIIGDLNSYDEEDPIAAILAGSDDTKGTADDFVDLIEKTNGEFAYSYVFDGQLGYLDYALATKKLRKSVTGVTEWHINSDEPDILDYDMSFKKAAQDALFEANPFRSSDHDPIIVGFDLAKPVIEIAASTLNLWPPNHSYRTISLDNLGITVEDVCDTELSGDDVVIMEVWTDETELCAGCGYTYNDIKIASDCRSVKVRSERQSTSNGRVYKVVLGVVDENGNLGKAKYTVNVPVAYQGNATFDGTVYSEEGCDPENGMARAVVTGDATTNEDLSVAAYHAGSMAVTSYPGSVNPTGTELELTEGRNVRLAIYDGSGREVIRVLEGWLEAGTHRLPLDLSDLANGMYVLHLTSGNGSTSYRMIIAR